MMPRSFRTMRVVPPLSLVAIALVVSGCAATTVTAQPVQVQVPAAVRLVWNGSFAKNIEPIFQQHCVGCHSRSRAENGLELSSYEGVMKGTQYGAVVVPGSPVTSTLLSVLKGTADLSIRMPHGNRQLSEQELQNVELWIGAGAPAN